MELTTFNIYAICVICVLNIILFFKIWGMTNNIRDIKRKCFRTYFKRHEIYKIINNPFYLKEDKSKILYDNMFNEIYEIYTSDISTNKDKELGEIKEFYAQQFDKIGIDKSIIPQTIEEFKNLID